VIKRTGDNLLRFFCGLLLIGCMTHSFEWPIAVAVLLLMFLDDR
jgi:hypothetical protein